MAKKRKQLKFCINPKSYTSKQVERILEYNAMGIEGFDSEYYIIRSHFPYGFIQDDETGAVVFFNREYEIMEFAGQKEFHIDVESVLDAGMQRVEGRYLFGTDGSAYVGTFYMFYTDINSPFWMDKPLLANYLQRLSRVMVQINDIVPNACTKCNITEEQERIYNHKWNKLIAKQQQKS